MVSMKRFLGVVVVTAILGAGYWYYLVLSYESDLGTDNEFTATDEITELTNGSDDVLFSLEFSSGTDELEWAFTTVTLNDGSTDYGCTAGGLSSVDQNESKVDTKLNADGLTFTLQIDSTSEESYTHLSLPNMKESSDSNFSLRFSKTDVYLGENAFEMVVEDVEFTDLNSIPENQNFSETSEAKLDWYDYDLSTHRVEPKNQIYVIQEHNITYKIQFLNYYNEADEARHVTMMVAWLDGDSIPAFADSSLVEQSPCLIMDEDGLWVPDEVIQIKENGIDICRTSCTLEMIITYEDVGVKGTASIELQ